MIVFDSSLLSAEVTARLATAVAATGSGSAKMRVLDTGEMRDHLTRWEPRKGLGEYQRRWAIVGRNEEVRRASERVIEGRPPSWLDGCGIRARLAIADR